MITAIIPARSGSKRLPNKNIRSLLGRPLIFHTIESVLGHSLITKVMFTTDSENYADLVRSEFGEQVEVQLRPPGFAGDKVKVIDEVLRLVQSNLISTDWFMLCLPTAPLRSYGTVKRFLIEWGNNPVEMFSATEYEFPIQFAFAHDQKDGWQPVMQDSPLITGNTRSQDLQTYYRPNGAIYLQRRDGIKHKTTFYENSTPFYMSRYESLDIDNELDFMFAELIMGNHGILNDE